jgi:hypothetical protein
MMGLKISRLEERVDPILERYLNYMVTNDKGDKSTIALYAHVHDEKKRKNGVARFLLTERAVAFR